jgi:hypothetical protein
MRLFDWFRGRKGGGDLKPAQACLLFVDGENGPPDPLLLVEAVERHAGMHPEVKIAYGKWNLLAKNTQKFGEAGFERVLADKGSNNADLMLSLKALREVQDRSQQGQTGAIYIAFKDDKGFAHLFNHVRSLAGWRVIFVTSSTDPPRSLANLADEVLVIEADAPGGRPPARRPAAGRGGGQQRRGAVQTRPGQKTLAVPATLQQEEARNLLRRGVRSIVTGSRTLNSFTGQLGKFLVRENFPDPKPKALYVACGAPKSWTTLKVLDHFVPELVTSEGSGSSAILRPVSPSPKQGGATTAPAPAVPTPAKPAPATAPPPAALPEGDRVQLLRKAVRQIVTGPVKVAAFNGHMLAFLASAGYPDLKTRAFYVACGASKRWTTLKVLEKFASDLVEWDEGAQGNEVMLRPVESAPAG